MFILSLSNWNSVSWVYNSVKVLWLLIRYWPKCDYDKENIDVWWWYMILKIIFFNHHFGHLGFGTFDLHNRNSRPHVDLCFRDGPPQLEADLIGLRTLKDFQSIFILHVVKVDLGTEQLVPFTQRDLSMPMSSVVVTCHLETGCLNKKKEMWWIRATLYS